MEADVNNLTQEEIAAGLAEPLKDRDYYDRRYGRGGWRPQPRHAIYQAGKWRPIDGGKGSKTNAHSSLSEAIVCAPAELVIMMVRATVAAVIALSQVLPA